MMLWVDALTVGNGNKDTDGDFYFHILYIFAIIFIIIINVINNIINNKKATTQIVVIKYNK